MFVVLHTCTLLYLKFYWTLSQNKELHLPNCIHINLTDSQSQPWQQLPQSKCQYITAIHVCSNCEFTKGLYEHIKHMAVKSTISLPSNIKTSVMTLTVITLTLPVCWYAKNKQTNNWHSIKTLTARAFYVNLHFKEPLNTVGFFQLKSPWHKQRALLWSTWPVLQIQLPTVTQRHLRAY